MKMISRSILTLLIVSAAMILLFGPKPHAHAPPGRIVISYWEKWTGTEADQMRQIVDDFNNSVGKDKGIYVEYLSISGVDQKTLTATAAGVPPDVAGLWDPQIAPFAARQALLPLDDLAAAKGIGPGFYKKAYWDVCHYNGHLWGLVSTPAAVALHYNKRQFYENASSLRAAGLDPTRAPRSIDELDRYARVLNIVKDGHLARAGYLPSEPGWYLSYTGFWFGGRIFDEGSGTFQLDSPENLAAWRWIASYSKEFGKQAVSDFQSGAGQFNTPQNPFLSGQVSMEQQGPWMANYIHMLKPDMSQRLVPYALERYLPRVVRPFNYDWGVAAFPSADGRLNDVTYAGFDVLVIPRGAKHPREAFEFIAYVNRQDVMEKLCRLHCKNSPLAAVSDDFIRTHPNPYIDVFERLAASDGAHGAPPIPISIEMLDEISNMTQRVIKMEQTPKEGLAEAQRRCQSKLARYELEASRRAGVMTAANVRH